MLQEFYEYLEWDLNEKVQEYNKDVVPGNLAGEPSPYLNEGKGEEVKYAVQKPLLLISDKQFRSSLPYPCSSKGNKGDKKQEYNAGKHAEAQASEEQKQKTE